MADFPCSIFDNACLVIEFLELNIGGSYAIIMVNCRANTIAIIAVDEYSICSEHWGASISR